jgi:hypothetical protein
MQMLEINRIHQLQNEQKIELADLFASGIEWITPAKGYSKEGIDPSKIYVSISTNPQSREVLNYRLKIIVGALVAQSAGLVTKERVNIFFHPSNPHFCKLEKTKSGNKLSIHHQNSFCAVFNLNPKNMNFDVKKIKKTSVEYILNGSSIAFKLPDSCIVKS